MDKSCKGLVKRSIYDVKVPKATPKEEILMRQDIGPAGIVIILILVFAVLVALYFLCNNTGKDSVQTSSLSQPTITVALTRASPIPGRALLFSSLINIIHRKKRQSLT